LSDVGSKLVGNECNQPQEKNQTHNPVKWLALKHKIILAVLCVNSKEMKNYKVSVLIDLCFHIYKR
jgi:hypothetical protein